MDDAAYMEQALALAREAAQEGEVPVGCIITLGDQVVGRGRNRRERSRNALSHGELEAIDQACKPWAAGVCGSVPCMSPWSPAPCVPEPLSTPGFPGWSSAPGIPRPGLAALCAICLQRVSIITRL